MKKNLSKLGGWVVLDCGPGAGLRGRKANTDAKRTQPEIYPPPPPPPITWGYPPIFSFQSERATATFVTIIFPCFVTAGSSQSRRYLQAVEGEQSNRLQRPTTPITNSGVFFFLFGTFMMRFRISFAFHIYPAISPKPRDIVGLGAGAWIISD